MKKTKKRRLIKTRKEKPPKTALKTMKERNGES